MEVIRLLKKNYLKLFFIILIFTIFLIILKSNFSSKPTLSQTDQQSQQIFNNCQKEPNKELCYAKDLGDLANTSDFDTAYNVLLSLQNLDPTTRNCHLIAHSIASSETKKDLSGWQKLLSKVSANSCNGGFVHGVIEEKTALDPNFILDKGTIPQICQRIREINGAEEATCVHIMGHLILLNTLGDLPKALDVCLQLDLENQDRCLGGVFMEYELRDNLVVHGITPAIKWNKETAVQQENICRNFKDDVLTRACWRELSRILVLVYPNDQKRIYEECMKSPPNKDGALECYTHSLGFIASSPNIAFEDLKELCSPLLDDKYIFLNCVMYVNSYLLNNSERFMDRSLYICENVPENHRNSCFNILAQTLKKLTNGWRLQQLCNQIPLGSQTYCSPD